MSFQEILNQRIDMARKTATVVEPTPPLYKEGDAFVNNQNDTLDPFFVVTRVGVDDYAVDCYLAGKFHYATEMSKQYAEIDCHLIELLNDAN